MQKVPLLTPEQERLVMHNLRLVIRMARHVPRVGMELADLVQEGVIGLMTAARKYDPTLGFRFSAYARHWIRQKMFREFQYNCNLIRCPIWIASDLIHANLKGKDEGFPPGHRAVVYTPWRLDYVSLRSKDPFTQVVDSERNAAISRALSRLSPRKREVIARRFGIGFDKEQSLEEIGRRLGLTRERVRQLECSALDNLALHEAKTLQPYSGNTRGEPPRAKAAKFRRELKSR